MKKCKPRLIAAVTRVRGMKRLPPPPEPRALRTLHAIAHTPAPPVRSIAAAIPPAVAALLDRALAFDPLDRFTGAVEMDEAVYRAYLDHRRLPHRSFEGR